MIFDLEGEATGSDAGLAIVPRRIARRDNTSPHGPNG